MTYNTAKLTVQRCFMEARLTRIIPKPIRLRRNGNLWSRKFSADFPITAGRKKFDETFVTEKLQLLSDLRPDVVVPGMLLRKPFLEPVDIIEIKFRFLDFVDTR